MRYQLSAMKYYILFFVISVQTACFAMKRLQEDLKSTDNIVQPKRPRLLSEQQNFYTFPSVLNSLRSLQYQVPYLRSDEQHPHISLIKAGEAVKSGESFSHLYSEICKRYSISHMTGIADGSSLLLVLAAARGHPTLVKYMLEVEPATSHKPVYTTSLLAAARGGHKHVVDYLIKSGVDVHEAWQNILATQDVNAALNLAQEQVIDNGAQTSKSAILLINALETQSKDFIAKLIAAGANVNGCSLKGMTPLMRAAQLGNKELVKLLLDNHADVNKLDVEQRSALIYAVQARNDEISRFFIAHGAQIEDDLLWAVINNDESLVSKLLAIRPTLVDVQDSDKGSSVLMCAIKKGNERIIQELLQKGASVNSTNKKGQTALMLAAGQGLKNIVELLLTYRADVNLQEAGGSNALMWAIYNGHSEIVRILLQRGTNIHARTKEGWDALMVAADKGGKEVVSMLIKAGADINKHSNTNDNALTRALLRKHSEVVDLLVHNAANIHKSLLLAASNGCLEVVTRLVELGANTSVRIPHKNSTPLVLAREGGYKEVGNFLELCTQPGLSKYCQDPTAYISYHIQQCFLNGRYPRTCLVNPDECCFEQKAPDHSTCYHQTVLMWACMFGHTNLVERMLLCSPPSRYINAQDKFGRTALHYAVLYGHTECIQELLRWYMKEIEYIKEVHADDQTQQAKALRCLGINLLDEEGNSALMYAIKKGNLGLVSRLIQAGARPNIKVMGLAAALGHKEIATKLLLLLCSSSEVLYPHIF